MDKISKIQSEIGVLSKKETNPFYNSKYMDINGLLANLQPLLDKYNLTLTQPPSNINGRPALKTRIWDKDTKEFIIDEIVSLPDIQDPQKMGSSITYYRRYTLVSTFALQAEDDDANKGSEKVIDYGKKETKKDYQLKNKQSFENGVDPLADDEI